jgi:hypothetical protein
MAFPYLEWKTVPVNLLKSRSEGKFGTVSRPADTTNLSHLNAPTPASGSSVGRTMILHGSSSDSLSIPTTQALKRHLFNTVRSLFLALNRARHPQRVLEAVPTWKIIRDKYSATRQLTYFKVQPPSDLDYEASIHGQ